MIFAREKVEGIEEEIKPLVQIHHDEVGGNFKFSPQFKVYERMEQQGLVRFFTARTDEGKLVGYALYFVLMHPHYEESLQARHDLLFVHPDYRGHESMRFLSYCDRELRKENVDAIHMTVTEKRDFSSILVRMGYSLEERVYVRRF